MSNQPFDLVIVGSGPAGLATASHAQENGMNYVLLERTDHLADTIFCYQARKYVMAEPMMIPGCGDLPFAAGSRESILGSWNDHVNKKTINVQYRQEVKAIAKGNGGFSLKTSTDEFSTRNIVLAMGTQGAQRRPGVPGEDLPHVYFRLVDPDEYVDQDILVVGAGDSAIEIALALSEQNRVGMVVRAPEIVRAKEALTREILGRNASGQLTIYFSTNLKQIYPDYTDLNVRGDILRVPAKHIFLKLGADPPRKFFESIGIQYTGKEKDARPVLSPTYQTSVSGLYLIGAASGRDLIKLGMNQGYEVIEHLMGREVEPADEAVLKTRLPYWEGKVRDRISQIREKIPIMGAADEEQLRELFLAAQVKEYQDGDTIVRQDDYTNDFLIIASGRVDISVLPDKSQFERKVAELTAGNFFGEMSLISGRRRSATATAAGTTRIIEIPRKSILKMLYTSPAAKTMVDQAFLIRAVQGYLFPDTPSALLGKLVTRATTETLAKGHVVFKEGDPADAFYLIRNGMVKISKTSGEREIVLSYLVSGNFFGEGALLSSGARTATVTTIFPSELIRLTKRDFDNFLAANPTLREGPLKKLEDRRIASLVAEATPGSGNILEDLIRGEMVMGTDALLIDDHKCVRCNNCIRACEGVHEDGQARLSLTGIKIYNVLAPNSCWHCENPLCMLDCPPDALARDARGEVYIKSNCIGCGNCERNCPYDNIFMVHAEPPRQSVLGWLTSFLGKSETKSDFERTLAVKCDLCRDIHGGPACVRACPTSAAIRVTPDQYRSTLEELVVTPGDT